MASKITIKRSLTAAAPAGLSYGEMAFVQGSGLTANQLYVGISGGNPVWVGAQIGTTGTWTDNAAKTSLATQYATDQRIAAQISGSGVSSVNGLTGAVINVALTTNPLSQFAATTSSQLLGVISDETGTGSLVFATNPTLSGVTLGAATATSINKVAITRPLSGSTITIDDNITFTVSSQHVTLNGSGVGSNVTVPATGTLATLAGAETLSNKTLSGVTLGTPLSGTLTNCTGLPVGTGISGLAANVATFLATPSSANLAAALTDETGSGANVFASSPTLVTPALGTPSALVGTNITGTATAFTASNVTTNANLTGHITSTGNATVLGTAAFTSANLAGALTDETGSGSAVFATSPTLVTPALGTPSALVGTNITGTATAFTASNVTTNANLTGHITSTGNAAILGSFTSSQLATALTDETGSGAAVFANTPTLVTPNIGAATGTSLVLSGDLTVNGTTTTLNSTTLTVDDINIELGSVATPTNITANGGGITLKGTSDKTIIWDSTNSNWTSSEDWNLPTGKVFKINNASVLSSTTLGSAIVTSSLTTVGTITSGTWSGSFGAVSGANLTTLTAGNLSGTIPSGVLGNSTVYIGTTAVALNRTTASLALTGISSIDGSAATVTGAAQSAITSVGTLTSLTVSGTLEAGLIDGGTF